MHLAHPFGITPGQVVVHRHHMDAAAGEGIEVRRQRRHQGLAFPGLHLGDLAVVQDHPAQQLHIEVAHAEHALTGLAHDRERLRQ